MKKAVIIIGVVILVLAGAGIGYAMTHKSTPAATTATQSGTTTPNDTPNTSANTTEATITYSDSGFSPAGLTVKAGTTVTIKNTSSRTVQFDSDPHPAHTDDQDLNAGLVTAGKSTTFVAINKGTFGYHNHLNASETGTIIVE